MKAARIHQFDPELEGPTFLEIDDVPEPTIEAPDDVIVRVGGAGVCRTDLHIIQGEWTSVILVDLPYTLGHENAGWIVDAGPGVTNVAEGDAVVVLPGMGDGTCPACRTGRDNQCRSLAWQGIQFDGGFTEFLRTKARNVVPLPPGMEPRAAAPYADAGLTTYHAAKRATHDLPPDQAVVIIGVGGLGHVGVQSLRAITASEIIAIDISQDALDLARELGADHTVLAGDDSVDQVMELTGGFGAGAVIDLVGEGDVPGQAFAMTATGGKYLVVGYGGTFSVPALDIMGSERQVIGNVGGTYQELRELLAMVERGVVRLLTEDYPFARINDALGDLAAGRVHGRAVIVPD